MWFDKDWWYLYFGGGALFLLLVPGGLLIFGILEILAIAGFATSLTGSKKNSNKKLNEKDLNQIKREDEFTVDDFKKNLKDLASDILVWIVAIPMVIIRVVKSIFKKQVNTKESDGEVIQ